MALLLSLFGGVLAWRSLEQGLQTLVCNGFGSAAVAIGYDGSFSAYCEQLCLQTPHVLCGPGFGGSGDGGFCAKIRDRQLSGL